MYLCLCRGRFFLVCLFSFRKELDLFLEWVWNEDVEDKYVKFRRDVFNLRKYWLYSFLKRLIWL